MTIYDELAPVAKELLDEFNQGVVEIEKLTPGTGPAYNPGPAVVAKTTLSGATSKGVSHKLLKTGLVEALDIEVIYPALGNPEPTLKDFIYLDGVRAKIVLIQRVPATGTAIVWKPVVRKGG